MSTTITYEVILKTEHSDLYGHLERTIATLTVPTGEGGDIQTILKEAVHQAITNIKHQEQLKNDPFLQWLKQKTVEEIKHQEQINNDRSPHTLRNRMKINITIHISIINFK